MTDYIKSVFGVESKWHTLFDLRHNTKCFLDVVISKYILPNHQLLKDLLSRKCVQNDLDSTHSASRLDLLTVSPDLSDLPERDPLLGGGL